MSGAAAPPAAPAAGWEYQVRIDLARDAAEALRRSPDDPSLAPLMAALARNGATLSCQYDAFAGFVAEAERDGATDTPLYRWTKATLADPAKREKYLKSFTVVALGRDLYPRATADAIEAALSPLLGGPLVTRLAKHDTNPANNPQPPKRFA